MNKEQFYKYLSDTSQFDNNSRDEIKSILDEFPYFQTGWILYTKNLYETQDLRFENKLKLAAVHIPDRKILKKILNNEYSIVRNELKEKTEIAETFDVSNTIIQPTDICDLQKIIDDRLNEIKNNNLVSQIDKGSEETTKKEEFFVEEMKNFTEKSSSNNELIDKFLLSNPRIIPDKNYNSILSLPDYSSILEEEDFFSETLAKIYIKQKYYDKAILTYEKLCLKYPEKSIYFANQIEKVKELIKN